MFTDHKISAFQQRVSDLPDTPALSASELKARFDACPEELRAALNAVCDDGKALEDRMDAYRAQTFTGEIEREMLSADVQEELSAKAEQDDLDAEAAARAAGDAALDTRLTTVETALPQKCEAIFGSYYGNAQNSMQITLGFQPAAVLVMAGEGWNSRETYSTAAALCLPGVSSYDMEITETGFTVYRYLCSKTSPPYRYIAFKPLT